MYKLIRTLLPVLAAMIATTVSAQSVSWKSSVQHLDGQTYRIVLEASIPAPWHMYDMGPYEGGPNATTITFTPGEGAVLEGGVEQLTRPERHYDKTFGMEIGTFARKAQFAQSVKLTAPQATVKAELAWMICNDTNCLPPDDTELTITLPAGATPAVQPAETPAKESAAAPETVPAAEIAPAQKDAAGGGSLWGLIIEAILWGFAALLTPCVFPMVPMTVSFFMKGSGSPALGRIRAGMYGFFIVALYTLPIAAIILITRLVGGDAVTADIFNWLATHWLPNILFFLVFMVFAASFFGAFEITMPSWMVNKTDSKADSKGLAGIFFMALTLVLVSFSCTGPIVGSVLIKSTAGEFWSPIVTMLAFSVAFALPFTLFAFFPSMLKKLPKSGGWLNSVKVVLGFIEVALGMKFLSVADQTYHWGLLDREIYLAVWIVTFSLLGLYLLGKIKFAHDSNYLTHYQSTALEIWQQTGGNIDYLVCAIGTSGTLMGLSRFLKVMKPDIKVVCAQPIRGHYIQGLKNMEEAIVPDIYDPSQIDVQEMIESEEAISMAREIIRREAIFAGMSSGAAMLAAVRTAQKIERGNIVVVFPDRAEKYLSTTMFDEFSD